MNPCLRTLSLTATVGLLAAGASPTAMAEPWGWPVGARAKNVVFLVPDGMGLSNVTATRIFKNGPGGKPLSFETLPQIGYQRTHSANSTVTDSSAAAGAWATGDKYLNGEISCHAESNVCVASPRTILEMAQRMGKATGLVVTSTITHATPAVWASHVHSRQCETEIGRQLVETGVDVLLGGGIGPNRSGYGCEQYAGQDAAAVVAAAQSAGYQYVTTKSELDSATSYGASKILGLFTPGGKTAENFRVDPALDYPYDEPTLAEMTTSALDVLQDNRRGFFLMVEGSQIDWADHANRLSVDPDSPVSETLIGETLGFDAATKVVLDWVNARPMRRRQTLVIVVADHDCGGFAINGPYGHLNGQHEVVEAGWTSGDHTAVDTIVWSQGPGSQFLGRALDNTDLFKVMRSVMR